MASVKLTFSSSLSQTDPVQNPLLIIGLPKNLAKVAYSDLSVKFASRISQEAFATGVSAVQTAQNAFPLYLNFVSLAPLPTKCSRHNTPSRAHAVSKAAAQFLSLSKDEHIVVVCKREDVFASACAIARSCPLYSRKTNFAFGSRAESPDGANPSNNNKLADCTVRVEFLIVGSDYQLTEEDCLLLERASQSVRLSARIVDIPCNEMHTDAFIEEVRQVADKLGLEPVIIRGEELKERGMGGIYGVGKAALHPPALVVLSHQPQGASQTIAWVGKGIVYDTGGLSIKGKTAMPGMKRDCGGAAGILGAFRLAVLQGFSQNLHAVFCLAENSVGPNATRPDDIHTLYSGRTVEINNTDAEGRLVLADGVAYAQKDLKADIILDMATLTGAQGIATGKYHAAVLTNDEDWEDRLVSAGLSSGDLTFPIPFSPELHFSEFASAVADMKNSVADRNNATSSCAGLFIMSHLGFDFPGTWMHVDMASPVHSGERATGYGVALLAVLFGKFIKNGLIQTISPQLERNEVDAEESARKKIRLE